MLVYHVSSAHIEGGAARAGLRLHCGLGQCAGVDSIWLDAGGIPDVSNARQIDRASELAPLWVRFGRTLWRRKIAKNLYGAKTPFSSPLGWSHVSSFNRLSRPDVWSLQWVSNFLDWERVLPWMAEQAPIVWTLHDLNPLMGVWHYVPTAEERNPKREQIEQQAMKLKRGALARIPKDRLIFVGPSKWMVEQCQNSPITQGFPVVHIPYGLDTGVFSPKDRNAIRVMYGISDDEVVLGFVADRIDDPRKGVSLLESAIASLPDALRVQVLTVGNGRHPQFKFPHHHLGGIQNDHLLSYFYSACDLFVCPSLQDNLPNTVLESIACGTPVIAYRTGGLPDMVRDAVSGFVVEPVGDSLALAAKIRSLIENPQCLSAMRMQSREVAIKEYTLAIQSARYSQLFARK